MNTLVQVLRKLGLRLAGLVMLLTLASCGPSPNLIVVNVQGLVSGITELYVTMQLDGAAARNSRPAAESGDSAFVVYNGMERFGVEVPSGTGTLSLDVKGFNATREVVRSGTGSLNLTTARELTILLSP